jgi:hypothetical protein
MSAKIMFGCVYEASLLYCIDRRGAITVIVSAAVSDLDENNFVMVRHHEIDFATSYPVISRNGA